MRFTSYAIQKRRTEVHSPRGQSISQPGYLRRIWAHEIPFSFSILSWGELGELWLICPELSLILP